MKTPANRPPAGFSAYCSVGVLGKAEHRTRNTDMAQAWRLSNDGWKISTVTGPTLVTHLARCPRSS